MEITKEILVRAGLFTSCREENPDTYERCGERAEFVLWGKLFKPEQLGPRCYNHAVAHTSYHMAARPDQWAVLDLRLLLRAVE